MLVKFPQGGVPRKKVLALVLTLALALSVAAGAAFTDQKQIKNTEAVDMCVALNIISGYPDGSFKPEGNITRAEFTKMICVMLNGGKEPTLGTAVNSSFTDVRGTSNAWADKYIESCVSQGIVSGVGGGKFNPAGNVTGSEAAKMLLVALGYKSDIESFTGSAWEVNVNVKATEKGLYDDLAGLDTSKALSRDNAAQMVWNALQAKEVKYDYTLVSENGQLVSKTTLLNKDDSLLEDKYDTKDTDDTTGILTAIKYNTTKEEYTYTISDVVKGAVKTVGTYTTEADFTELLGHNVTFVVKDNSAKDVYGAYAKDSAVLVSGLVDDIDAADVSVDASSGLFNSNSSIEVNDTDYDIDTYATVFLYGTRDHAVAATQLTAAQVLNQNKDIILPAYYTFTAIDNDDDDDIDVIIVYPVDFGKITYVGSDYVRVAVVDPTTTNNSDVTTNSTKYDTDKNDYVLYKGAAKDDYALVSADTSLKTLGNIALLEKQTGKVTSTSKDTAVIGGNSYDISYQTAVKSQRNKTVDFRAINGFVVWSDASNSVDVTDYVLVTGISGSKGVSGYYEASLLFTDGKTVTAPIKNVTIGNTTHDKGDVATYVDEATLWSYEISSGKYELTALPATNMNGAEGFDMWMNNGTTANSTVWSPAKKSADADAKISFTKGTGANETTIKCKIDPSAVVFVKDGDDYSVKTGSDLAKVTGAASVYYAGVEENDNGYSFVTFAFVNTSSVSASDVVYGFVTTDISVDEDSDGTYYSFTAWNGTEYAKLTTVDVTSSDFSKSGVGTVNDVDAANASAGLVKQAIIGYKLNADNKVTEITVYTGTVGALTAFDGEDLMINGASYTTDKDDTTILYIDRDGKKGETSGSFAKADEVDANDTLPSNYVHIGDKNYYANVLFYKAAGSTDLDLLVVDVTNDWYNVQK